MRTSDETIRELERLSAERTQGEWITTRVHPSPGCSVRYVDAPNIEVVAAYNDLTENIANTKAIAAAVNALPNLLADLRDLAAMEQRDRDGPCHFCGEPTQRFAGDPSRWPVYLCHADEPGVAKPHHAGCVSERLAQRDRMADRMNALGEERDQLRAELAEWKAAFKVDDREGDSRLMAVAMGQALDAALAEVEQLQREYTVLEKDAARSMRGGL